MNDLASLGVLHFSKHSSVAPGTLALVSGCIPEHAFHLETCQRSIWIFDTDGVKLANFSRNAFSSGLAAYSLLLKIASGLESRICGETEVFGQLKSAWKVYSTDGANSPFVTYWMQRLFEDTKEVRSRYLQNLGGSSYGSLVRKLLAPTSTADETKPLLVVGAGQIAQAVLPWLADCHSIWLWNRSKRPIPKLGTQIRVLESEAEEQDGWRKAANAVICIPLDPDTDSRRIRLWREAASPHGCPRKIIHLGGHKHQCGEWNKIEGFYSLDDVFALQQSQQTTRQERIAKAHQACDEIARFRSVVGVRQSANACTALAFGWEDLPVSA